MYNLRFFCKYYKVNRITVQLHRGVIVVANNNRNQLLVPGAENAVDNMKEEIASEMNVVLGAETTARENGSVGGEMVKRMIKIAEESMANRK